MITRSAIAVLAVTLIAGASRAQLDVAVVNAFPNLTFDLSVDIKAANDGTDRLFVVERGGLIWVFPNDPSATNADREPFLDFTSILPQNAGDEIGLTGIVFHPDYETNGTLFITYTGNFPGRRSRLSRFQVDSADPNRVDIASEQVLLIVNQPRRDHNMHRMVFGPDNLLYVSVGDGGCCDDPFEVAQDRTDLRGSIIRIDVDSVPDPGLLYAIPPTNPFVGNTQDFREEIFIYGLRNPWRFSFDADGRLWIGDVGQDDWEEISWGSIGANMGWPILEGSNCFDPPANCDASGLVMPIVEHPHQFNANGGFAITGGHVYEGSACGDLKEKYVYADFLTGNIWALSFDDNGFVSNENIAPLSGLNISAFGLDESKELYAITFRPDTAIILGFTCKSELCLGDCDASGAVDFNDLVSMLFAFGQDTGDACDADESGVVDFNDLVAALFVFGACK